jgi:hypothetical protein
LLPPSSSALAKDGHPDHTVVLRCAHEGGVAVGDSSEAKGGDVVERLAEALDDHRCVRFEDVTALAPEVAQLAVDDVATVDRYDDFQTLARAVREPQVVALAVGASEPRLASAVNERQRPSTGSLDGERN